MKKAVIVVGHHYAGKSKTIRKFFKPLVGLSGNSKRFWLGQQEGFILSQSLEERFGNGYVLSQSLEERNVVNVRDEVKKYKHYDLLVFAARPNNEAHSLCATLKSELESNGYSVAIVSVVKKQSDAFYAERGQEILQHLQ